jgi:hypothetical protein
MSGEREREDTCPREEEEEKGGGEKEEEDPRMPHLAGVVAVGGATATGVLP